MKVNKFLLEVVVFVCGAVVMIFELVGSRILGPYFGTSTFVWTSLIGIIMGSLSLGYYWGGKIADKKPNLENLTLIIFLAGVSIGLTTVAKDFLASNLCLLITDIRLAAVIASMFLFFPASVFLGMVSPYAVKLKMNSLDNSASTVGNLYAISTAGSIFGTFLSGFYLIPSFGTNNLLIILLVVLVVIAFILSIKRFLKIKLLIVFLLLVCSFTLGDLNFIKNGKEFKDFDTAYNRIWIYNGIDKKSNKLVKMMRINSENHSSMYLESDDLVNEYTKYYHLAKHFKPDFNKALMLGGAGYSYPKSFLATYPEARIDVVEIDPKVTELAKKYFKLKDDSRLTIYHEDARVYLNKTQEKYDVIFGDAFGSRFSLPYQLTTREAVQKKYNILNDGGLVILNIISSINGDKGEFLRAEYATYKSLFPQVFLFPVRDINNGWDVQNIILVALKSKNEQAFTDLNPKLNEYLQHLWKNYVDSDIPILTDDYAPVDYYVNKVL